MGIYTTPLYTCDSCKKFKSTNPYEFRILDGSIMMGSVELIKSKDTPEVLCIECFTHALGIGGDHDSMWDVFSEDARYDHIMPGYEEKKNDTTKQD